MTHPNRATRPARGGLRLVHSAYAVEARRSLESPAGYYRRYPAPSPPRPHWFVRLLLRVAVPVAWSLYATALLMAAWFFVVLVLA